MRKKNLNKLFMDETIYSNFKNQTMDENKDSVNKMTTTNVVNSECYIEVPNVWEHVVLLSNLVEQLEVAADKFCSIQDHLSGLDYEDKYLCDLIREFAPHASALCFEINRHFKDIDPYSTLSVAEQIDFYENLYGFKIQENKELEEYLKNVQNTNN